MLLEREKVRLLIVDGYNVIRLTPPYRDMAAEDLDSARAALVTDVAAYAGDESDATVVFDGGANQLSDGTPHSTAGVTVIFSPYGIDADTVIERLARQARERGDQVDVVTSDAQTQWAVMGSSVARRSSAEFASELSHDREAWSEHSPIGARSSRIEERIDPAVREVLEKWARGQR